MKFFVETKHNQEGRTEEPGFEFTDGDCGRGRVNRYRQHRPVWDHTSDRRDVDRQEDCISTLVNALSWW